MADDATEAIERIRRGGVIGDLIIDIAVKDNRLIQLLTNCRLPVSYVEKQSLFWPTDNFFLGSMYVPNFISLSHEFAHFILAWYGYADYDEWYRSDGEVVMNVEKMVVNIENLIRAENGEEKRVYYTCPAQIGEEGLGEIPEMLEVEDILKEIHSAL